MTMNTMPGKRSRADMQGAFEGMHASEDMYEKVMARASHRGCKRGGAPKIAVVATVALAVALAAGGTAYAVLGGDFFFRGWGDHGHGQVNTWTVDGDGVYSRTFGTVDEGELTDELKVSVEYAGRAVEARGYTLLVESVLVDDLGCGAATFTLSNPDGIKINPAYGMPGDAVFDDTSDLRLLTTEFGDGTFASDYVVYDAEASTDTEMRGTIYFNSWQDAGSIASGVKWILAFNDEEAATDTFVPKKAAKSHELKASDGARAMVSPIALVIDEKSVRDADEDIRADDYLSIRKASVTLKEGENLLIVDEEALVFNIFGSMERQDEDGVCLQTVYRPTQLLKPEQIASINVSGNLYDAENESTAWQAEFLPTA